MKVQRVFGRAGVITTFALAAFGIGAGVALADPSASSGGHHGVSALRDDPDEGGQVRVRLAFADDPDEGGQVRFRFAV